MFHANISLPVKEKEEWNFEIIIRILYTALYSNFTKTTNII